jgi:hypothetical protein
MDSFRETMIDFLEKFLFQLNLLFDLENSTPYIVLVPFLRNIAQDPLAFFITMLALFLIPYVMIRVRRNSVTQGEKAEKLLKKLETTERSVEVPAKELELPELESTLDDKTPEPLIEENKVVEVEEQTTQTDDASDPELEFLRDLSLDSMYTKTYSIEGDQEENESEEPPIPDDEAEEVVAGDPVKDAASPWEFAEEGPGTPEMTRATEENPADFEEVLHEYPDITNIEEPENVLDENLDEVSPIDDLTKQMEATIETISNQIITEDLDKVSIPAIPADLWNADDSSPPKFDSEHAEKEEPNSLQDDEEPAVTTPVPPEEVDAPSLKEEHELADTAGLNEVLGIPLEEDENAEPISNEVLQAESPETGIVEPVEPERTKETENEEHSFFTRFDPEHAEREKEIVDVEKKTKLLVDRLENFQKHLEKRLTTLELTIEKRKTGKDN